jgi:hypothetical protein
MMIFLNASQAPDIQFNFSIYQLTTESVGVMSQPPHHPKKEYSVRGDEGSKSERKRKLLENNKPKKEIK